MDSGLDIVVESELGIVTEVGVGVVAGVIAGSVLGFIVAGVGTVVVGPFPTTSPFTDTEQFLQLTVKLHQSHNSHSSLKIILR